MSTPTPRYTPIIVWATPPRHTHPVTAALDLGTGGACVRHDLERE